jgi:hypothetical protein
MSTALSFKDFLQQLDEYFTREDLRAAYLPLLDSLKDLVPINSWSYIEELKERVTHYDFESDDDDMLFWEVVSELEIQLQEIGNQLMLEEPGEEITYARVEGYPPLLWLDNFYSVVY